MATATEEIIVKNAGPVEAIRIPIPTKGGVVLLTGENGAGKSEVLKAVDKLLGKDCKITRRDGVRESGSVEGFGVTLRVAASTRRSGELTFATLDEDFELKDLVNPPEKDPAAADLRRIKTYVRMNGYAADPSLFFRLLPSEALFREMVTPSTLEKNDLVDMAAAIKRDLEAKARAEAAIAENATNRSVAIRDSIKDLDLTNPLSVSGLQQELSEAIKEKDQIEFAAKLARESAEKAIIAKGKLIEAESKPRRNLADLQAEHDTATRDVLFIDQEIKDLESKIVELKLDRKSRNSEAESLFRELEATATLEASLQGWRSTIEQSEKLATPDQETLTAASNRISEVQSRLQSAGVIERALAQEKEAVEQEEIAKKHGQIAQDLRDAAKGTEEVLSDLISASGGPVKVVIDDNGKMRLAVKHARRGECFISELSEGERMKLALPVAINRAKKRAEMEGRDRASFTIDQSLWAAIQPKGQSEIHAMCEEAGVVALAAVCTDDEEIGSRPFAE